MLSIWAGKREPSRFRPDRRDQARAIADRPRVFLDFLERMQIIDTISLEKARAALDMPGRRPLAVLLTELGLVHEATLVKALAEVTSLAILREDEIPEGPVLPHVITSDYCARARVLPLSETESELLVAAVDVFDGELVEALGHLVDRRVSLRIVGPVAFEQAYRSVYGEADDSANEDAYDDLAHLQDVASQAPIVRLAGRLVRRAFELAASDIHIEAEETDVRIRYRVDGVLIESERLAKSTQLPLTTRIKILAGLNIAERRLPQDGRMKVQDRGQDIDIRISTMPTAHGESIVMRVLDGSRKIDDFAGLGFDAAGIAMIDAMMRRPNGLVLVTGPTGSGKTTTLYAALRAINGSHLKVVTVEDPVEYRMAGVNQVQAHPGIGLDFATALRSILRQDPDVVMVGEIRDAETARIAVQAALTGHLVISTLHTNSAPATVTRLIDMGVEPFLISAVLKGVVAQRLLRRVCADCADTVDAKPEERIRLGLDASGAPVQLRQARGCANCNGTGYRGRMVVSEIMPMSAELCEMIAERADEHVIGAAAEKAGMVTLAEAARSRLFEGKTTLEEIERLFEGLT